MPTRSTAPLENFFKRVSLQNLSKIPKLPILHRLSPRNDSVPNEKVLAGFLEAQTLCQTAANEVASHLTEGWSEIRAAHLLETYLRDSGVTHFFHAPFAWFGERSRFDEINTYRQFQPSQRIIHPGEVYILDVAAIYKGFVVDIGLTYSLGENPEYELAKTFLKNLRDEIPKMFERHPSGSAVWKTVDNHIRAGGYENIHKKYPFSVLGHRVYHGVLQKMGAQLLHFGWQSYWELLSRGLFGQLLTEFHEGTREGLWAIEPHLGTPDFGAKFEEILVVGPKNAYWLNPNTTFP